MPWSKVYTYRRFAPDTLTKITEMINEHRSDRNVGLSENDKFVYPDSAKGSVTYDLEYSFVDPDTGEEAISLLGPWSNDR